MTDEMLRQIYDRTVPHWRDARRVGAELRLRCPLHNDRNPSLDIHTEKLVWTCRAGCGDGGAVDLAQRVLGKEETSKLIQELDGAPPRDSTKGACVRSTPSDQPAHVHTPRSSSSKSDTSGVSLGAYAAAVGCTRQELEALGLRGESYRGRPAVRIPYYDREGQEVARRWRLTLENGDGPDQRFAHRRGDPLGLYGLWRVEGAQAAGYVIVVEGESDCHVLWQHGFPALGVPGAGNFKADWAEHLDGIDRVVAIREPDQGGETFIQKLVATDLADRLCVVDLSDAKDARSLWQREPERFRENLQAALDRARPFQEEQAEEADARRESAWVTCRELAESPDILARFVEELSAVGVVGEERYAQIIYLALTSRLLAKPISVVGKGPSAAGKSFVLERVIRFFPEAACYVLSGMSEHALAYGEESLSHRMLVIYEAAGMANDFTSYLIRSLLSEGRIRYETVEKTAEGLRSRLIEREGPTGLLVTTTAVSLHPENETRILSVTANDSQKQTAAVLLATASESNTQPDLEPWHELQEWLALSSARVTIPYAKALAKLIPPVAVRLRRDFGQVLSLIRAHALLHQATRKSDDEGQVVATIADYAAIREVVADLIAEGVGATVSETMRETVKAVATLARGDETVTVAQLAKELKLDSSAASRRARAAAARGFLRNLEMKRRQRAEYVLGDPLPDDRELLPSPEKLKSVCTCARTLEGVEGSHAPAEAEPAEREAAWGVA